MDISEVVKPEASGPPPKSNLIYYLLAVLNLSTISLCLLLNYQIMGVYVDSIGVNQQWAERVERYSYLRRLAGDVNAPGNDIFDSRDADRESEKMRKALRLFNEGITAEKNELTANTAGEEISSRLMQDIDAIHTAMGEMAAEADFIFSSFARNEATEAGRHMAAMDRKYYKVNAAFTLLEEHIRDAQRSHFDEQMATASSLQKVEYIIAACFLLIVGGVTFYGRRLSLEAAETAREREGYTERLRRSNERFETVSRATNDAVWDWNLVTNGLWWNTGVQTLFRYAAKEVGPDVQWWCENIHPADRDRVVSGIHALIDRGEQYWSDEYRFRRGDGSYAFIYDRGFVEHDDKGKPVRMIGAIMDITERRRMEERLKRESTYVHLLQVAAVAANEAKTIEEAIHVVLYQVCAHIKWQVGHAFLVSDSKGELISSNQWHLENAERFEAFKNATESIRFAPGDGFPGQAWQSGKPHWITDATHEMVPQRMKQAEESGIKAGVVSPILMGSEVVAVMEFFTAEATEPDESLLEILTHIGAQLGRVAERQRAETKFRVLLESAPDAIVIVDGKGRIVLINSQTEKMFGYSRDELSGKSVEILLPERFRESHVKHRASYDSRRSQRMGPGRVLHARRKDGEEFPAEITLSPVKAEGGPLIISVLRDFTERKRSEERLNHLATHDPLTNLPNRRMLSEILAKTLPRHQRHKRLVAVMFLDLDRFKIINDTLGHDVGDGLLKGVAKRLVDLVREGDTVVRMGGDEFVLILTDVAEMQDPSRVAQRILDSLSKPFAVEGHELFITTSIGISLFPGDGENPETLLKNADAAMYRAKEQGKNNYQYYSSNINAKASERLSMENSLRHALERGEFLLHYQPRVDLATGRIFGAEALIRWQHPERGLVSPAEFIPLAEETGLIVPIGEWVLRTACAQNKAWQTAGLSSFRVAVNLSGQQFQEKKLVEMVLRALRESDLSPRFLELELTESIIMKNAEQTIGTLCKFHGMGIEIAIDDFGIGYSSLNYLKRFPISRLKIDQSFVRDITTDPDDSAIVAAIITMAHSLKLKVVAEAVETSDQLEFLRQLQCDEIQGYLFSRPLPPEEMTKLLKVGKRL